MGQVNGQTNKIVTQADRPSIHNEYLKIVILKLLHSFLCNHYWIHLCVAEVGRKGGRRRGGREERRREEGRREEGRKEGRKGGRKGGREEGREGGRKGGRRRGREGRKCFTLKLPA